MKQVWLLSLILFIICEVFFSIPARILVTDRFRLGLLLEIGLDINFKMELWEH